MDSSIFFYLLFLVLIVTVTWQVKRFFKVGLFDSYPKQKSKMMQVIVWSAPIWTVVVAALLTFCTMSIWSLFY